MPAPSSQLATLLVLAVLAGLAGPAAAHAGSYTVTGACADWELDKQPAVDANSTGCDFALANSVQPGAPPAAAGNTSRWLYRAPGGAFVSGVSMIGGLSGQSGWQARVVFEAGGPPTIVGDCPSDSQFRPIACGSFLRLEGQTGQNLTQLVLQVQCAATSCPRDGVYSRVNTVPSTINVTIKDSTAPGAAVTGGTLLDGWRSGTANFTYDAGDNVGIRSTGPVVDGALQDAATTTRGCDYSRRVPCPNGGGSFQIDTRRFSDGAHAISVATTDTADNAGQADRRRVLIDNTAPASPLELGVAGGRRGAGTTTSTSPGLRRRRTPHRSTRSSTVSARRAHRPRRSTAAPTPRAPPSSSRSTRTIRRRARGSRGSRCRGRAPTRPASRCAIRRGTSRRGRR